MERRFNFTSQICTTKEQSERLLALGLKKETADCCWSFNIGVYDESRRYTLVLGKCEYMHDIPAWSLHRLIEMMPTYIDVVGDEWTLNIIQGKLIAYTTDENDDFLAAQAAKSLYDSIICTIEWLIQAGHFNNEYLEE